ncbi:MAG: VIT1/CCC1 transporter family protein, partial [Candidatus Eremiobacteraeota bacterium]|nr:VIT1/CCC1 transporter family protein [Candidatus Eremiobacteraeota bacterium]
MHEHAPPLAAAQGRRPRIPDTPQRASLERSRRIREIVFGAQDGLLTTLGIVTGVGGATDARATILLAGGISTLVGALSMGVGEYLGGKAEREVVEHWVDVEQREMLENTDEEIAEQIGYYRQKGFPPDEARMIVDRLTKHPDIWLHEMVRDEFGIDPRDSQFAGLSSTFAMAGSFAAGGIIPVLPYLFPLSHLVALLVSLVLAVCGLFVVGVIAARIAQRSALRKGLEIVAFGAAVFG